MIYDPLSLISFARNRTNCISFDIDLVLSEMSNPETLRNLELGIRRYIHTVMMGASGRGVSGTLAASF